MSGKRVIYDGACDLCIRSKTLLIMLGLAKKEHTWAYQEMPDQYLKQVDYERFRNEMALIDIDGGPSLYGPEAVSNLLSGKSSFLKSIFSIKVIYQLFSFVYRVIAYNRTAIMTPDVKKIRCESCEPDTPPVYRWYWTIFALGVGVMMSLSTGVFAWNNLFSFPFYLGFIPLLFLYYLWLEKTQENHLEILAHSASLLLQGMVLLSFGFWLVDIFGGSKPLSLGLLLFAVIMFLLAKLGNKRAQFLKLGMESKILAALFMGHLFLIFYFALIF